MEVFKLVFPIAWILVSLVSSSTGALTGYQKKQCKQWHNYYRLMHQVARVNLDADLEKKAVKWANYLARTNKFEHESNNAGNLYATRTKESNPCKVAIMAFYSEEKKYNYKKPGWSAQTGHFTQLVWKSTKKIGVAWVQRRDKMWVLVIKYSPLGNDGRYAQNVFPRRVVTVKPQPTRRTTIAHKGTDGVTTIVTKGTDGVTTIVTNNNATWSNTTIHLNGTNSTVGAVLARSVPLRCQPLSCYAVGVMTGIFVIFLK